LFREKCGLEILNIEVLDIILLAAFLMVKSTNLEKIVIEQRGISNLT